VYPGHCCSVSKKVRGAYTQRDPERYHRGGFEEVHSPLTRSLEQRPAAGWARTRGAPPRRGLRESRRWGPGGGGGHPRAQGGRHPPGLRKSLLVPKHELPIDVMPGSTPLHPLPLRPARSSLPRPPSPSRPVAHSPVACPSPEVPWPQRHPSAARVGSRRRPAGGQGANRMAQDRHATILSIGDSKGFVGLQGPKEHRA